MRHRKGGMNHHVQPCPWEELPGNMARIIVLRDYCVGVSAGILMPLMSHNITMHAGLSHGSSSALALSAAAASDSSDTAHEFVVMPVDLIVLYNQGALTIGVEVL